MNSEEQTNDLLNRLESLDPVASEPVPAGWSRRSWVRREAVAFAAIGENIPNLKEIP